MPRHRRALSSWSAAAIAAAICARAVMAQGPAAVDIASIGPAVGQAAPEFSGIDQFGRRQTLASSLGARGAMLVFFRSADW